ncbi:hypothetical protein MLD38_034142 [Melastoma candidum]|uniref:Uncharacterized protein n=1 Tax=Melastoma candidum TaxID=119954 RepID=A0ACB9M9L4_9MYRT|nr:hypothetical protein MLD38_034142 [Melastoma candidum]
MMSPYFVTLLWSCVLLLIVRWGWRAADWLWMKPRKLERILRLQGLSGNPYRFLFGDLRENSRLSKEVKSRPITLSDDPMPRLLSFIHHSVKNYGKDSFTWFGPTPRVIVSSPQLLKDVFLRMDEFQKPRLPMLVKLLAEGLANLEGDKWAMHRKIINPAFHVEKLKLMLPAFYSSSSEMISRWEKLVSSGEGQCEIDVWPELQNLTRDVISRTAFGSSFQQGRRIFELQNELVELVMKTMTSIFIPGWRFLPTKVNQRMKSIDREVQKLLRDMIHTREKAMKAGEAPTDDLLGLLLESNMKQIQNHDSKNKMGMSIQDVIEECKLFYFAGQETTSVLLVWTMVLLGAYPEWQERAREEVLKVFGRNKPDFDQLNHLKIVTMILYEGLNMIRASQRYEVSNPGNGNVAIAGAVGIRMAPVNLRWGSPQKQETILSAYDFEDLKGRSRLFKEAMSKLIDLTAAALSLT